LIERLIIALPRRVISKCPAIKFAVKRTQRVKGRMIFLINSIITIKFIKGPGVPWGSKWDKEWLVFCSQPKETMVIQKVRDKGRVILKWEEREKICGYKAVKFIIKINRNKDKIVTLILFSIFFNEKLISFLNIDIMVFFILLKELEFFSNVCCYK